MTHVTPFDYSGQRVRVVTIGNDPWFVLADLARVLGIANVKQLRDRLDDGVCQTYPITDSLGRVQNAAIVSEAGMYEVVLRSDKPEAVTFRRWITHEVVPSIRRTGSYGIARELTPDEIVHQALQITTNKIIELEARAAITEPKAAAFDRWLSSNVGYAVADVAKALRAAGALTGRNRLFEFMAEQGWLYRDARGQWHPYQTQSECDRLRVQLGKQTNNRTGEEFETVTVRVTPKGAMELARRYGVDGGLVAEALDGEVAA